MGELVLPSVLFLTIVAPLWLVLHYRFKSRALKGISENDLSELELMLEKLDTLANRVETLESLLDSDDRNWRKEGKYE